MIDLAKLTQADIGRRVIYGSGNQWLTKEQGIITSWNHLYVFVRYARPQGDMSAEPRWNPTAAATRPEDLTFAEDGQ